MAEPTSSTPYAPIGEEPSGIATLARRVLPIALVALVAVSFFAPEKLRRLVPGASIDPNAVRFFAILLLFVLVAVSSARQTRRRNEARRAALAAFAASVGGRVVERPLRATTSGWEGGVAVEYEVQGRPVRLMSDRGRNSVYGYRLVADIVLRRDFQLQVVPGGKAMRFVLSRSFLMPALTVAAKTAGSARVQERRFGDGRSWSASVRVTRSGSLPAGAGTADTVGSSAATDPALLVERLRYLGGEPVTTGDPEFDKAYLVKASDRDAARDLLSDSSVRAAFSALTQAGSGFQMGVESEAAGGPGRLVVTVSQAAESPALFAAMDAALRATLGALARLELIEGGTRGVA